MQFEKIKSSILNNLYYVWAWFVYCVTLFQVDIFPKNKPNVSDNSKQTNDKEKTSSHFLKSADKFRELDEKDHNHQKSISTGKNKGKSIVRKKPAENEKNKEASKFQNDWMTKEQKPKETVNEIIASEPMKMLLGGEDFAPKYRLWKKKDGTFVSVSKMLKNFTTFSVLKVKDREENPKNYESTDIEYESTDIEEDNKNYYRAYIKFYTQITSEVKNFDKMLAVCLLFGKDDVHPNNWGIILKDGEKYAATVDHGKAMERGFDMYSVMYSYGHRKERIVTEGFAKSCLDVVEEFQKQKESIRKKIAEEIEGIKGFAEKNNIKLDVNEQMKILEENSYWLKMLAHQIRAEIAIIENKPEDLREALNELIKGRQTEVKLSEGEEKHIIVPAGRLLSQQNYRDGFVGNIVDNFELLIKTRLEKDDDKLRSCVDLYVEKGQDCITDWYKNRMTDEDRRAEIALLAVYNEVLEFAKANEGKAIDQAKGSKPSHVERLGQRSNLATNQNIYPRER